MHTVFALLCFVVVIHWLIFPYPSGLLHWHCGNQTIAPVPAKQPWWIWINTSCECTMHDCITTTKQSTTKPCAYFLGYTVFNLLVLMHSYSGRTMAYNGCQWLGSVRRYVTSTHDNNNVALTGYYLPWWPFATYFKCIYGHGMHVNLHPIQKQKRTSNRKFSAQDLGLSQP